jgi:hypothetical protein
MGIVVANVVVKVVVRGVMRDAEKSGGDEYRPGREERVA